MSSFQQECEEYAETDPNKDEYSLDDIVNYLGRGDQRNLCRACALVVKHIASEHIISFQRGRPGRGHRAELRITRKGFLMTGALFRKAPSTTKGVIYGFNLKYAPDHFKVGRTVNWINRKKVYRGMNTPGDMFLMRAVDNTILAEKVLLTGLRRHDEIHSACNSQEFFKTTLTVNDLINVSDDLLSEF